VTSRHSGPLQKLTISEGLLVLFFMLTLPFSNPWVRGDGVGYYAFARSLLIEHRLDFRRDWLKANATFQMGRLDSAGNIKREEYTVTGHLNNHFSIGPAILWFPFLIAAHGSVLLLDRFGGRIPADGYSRPYIVAMALATALYGFGALFISFRLARKYVSENCALVATLGIWMGSSLPVYMYLNPSWSHAQSAFMAALFFWYWNNSRRERSFREWVVLGAIGGLMMDVYYVSAVLLIVPLLESLIAYWKAFNRSRAGAIQQLFLGNIAFAIAVLLAFLPTLITKKIIYGSYLNFGYVEHWYWHSPALLKVAFASEHGLFSWTPLLLLAVSGLFLLRRYDRDMAFYSAAAFGSYLYVIGCYQDWHGISSFGSRFFVLLTPLFVLGLAVLFDLLTRVWQERRAVIFASGTTALFVLWNLGLIFQWGIHLIPARGPISWRNVAHNQVVVVPVQAEGIMKSYLTRRNSLMDRIEQEDVNQLKSERYQETER
jgi:hypothetical protein